MEESTLETRIREAVEELGKMNYDDPNRGKLINEIKTLKELQLSEQEADDARLNNAARNDIDERRLEIEEQKVQNDKRKNGTDIAKLVVYSLLGVGMSFSSYMMDNWFHRDSSMYRFGEKLHDFLMKK